MISSVPKQLLTLYSLATSQPLAEFEQAALRLLGTMVGFNGSIWGRGRPTLDGKTVAIDSASIIDRPDAIVQDYARLPPLDPVTIRFLARPGESHVVEVDEEYRSPGLLVVREFLRAYDVGHLMLHGWREMQDTSVSWMTVYRSPGETPFNTQDRALLEALVPHWVKARQICELTHPASSEQSAPAMASGGAVEGLPTPEKSLTDRQQETLLYLSMGMTYKQIAAHLGISDQTVKDHARHVYEKLGARNRTEAAREGRKLGFIE